MAKLPDPRKLLTGTSYSAKGALPVDKGAEKELGSANTAPIREVVPELAPSQVLATYEKMTMTDSTTDVSLRAGKVPIFGADFFIEPYSDNQIDLDIAEFVDFNIFHGLNTPWLIVLEDVLRMFEQGFSVIEKVYELREWGPKRSMANRRKYTMLRKLAPRPAVTIKDFEYDDNGGPVGVIQNALDAQNKVTEVTLPISKLIIFTLNKKGGNLRGKSLLRTSYQHWFYKKHFYNIDAIQAERHGIGVPDIELQPGYTPEDKNAAHELGRNLRTNEWAYIVRPPGLKVGFAKIEGQLVDVIRKIEHHDGQIMLNVMVQFLLLGIEGSGGGRATSGSHMDMFIKSLRYVANLICEYMNLYVVPQLVAYNFDTPNFPKMQARNIGESKDLQMFAAALANLADKELITLDLETEQWVRRIYDMPLKQGERPAPVGVFGTPKPDPNSVSQGPDGNSGVGNNDNTSTVGNNGGQGNVGKSPSSAQ